MLLQNHPESGLEYNLKVDLLKLALHQSDTLPTKKGDSELPF